MKNRVDRIEIFYQLVKVWIALLVESLLMQNAKNVVSSFDFRNTDATTKLSFLNYQPQPSI